MTKKANLKGNETMAGGTIIMPIDIRIAAITRSMIRKGRKIRNRIWKARAISESMKLGISTDSGASGPVAICAALRPDAAQIATGPEAPLSVLIPSFMLSEIARAFQIRFLIFLPFLIIDLVIAAILMSMGMMMVPPAIVSLPFKLAFFVIADGWTLIADSLVRGYM